MDDFLTRTETALQGLREQLRSGRYTVPLIVIGVLFALTSARALGDDFAIVMGHAKAGMFIYADDRLGDFFKAALSFKRITGVIITTHAYTSWPQVYQDYLLTKYTNAGMGEQNSFHVMPLAGLIFLLAAKLIVIAGLWKSYILFLAVYGVLVGTVVWLMHKCGQVTRADLVVVVYIFLFSYPALWMFQRGNFHAGFTSAFLAFYVFSAAFRRYRRLGWLCLALAVNLRPNVAILATLEFVTCSSLLDGVISIAIPASLSVVLLVVAYFGMNGLYPEYSVASFLKAQAYYNVVYIQRPVAGDLWNSSMYQLSKLIRHGAGFQSYYSAEVYAGISIFAAAYYLLILYLAIQKKLSAIELTFLLCAFTVLFTPVFALYHMLEFSGPLLLILAGSRPRRKVRREYWLIFALTLLMLVPLGGRQSNGAIEVVLLVLGSALIVSEVFKRKRTLLEIAGSVV